MQRKTIYLTIWIALTAVLTCCGAGRALDGVIDGVAPNEWALDASTPDGQTLLLRTHFGGVASNCARFEGFTVEQTETEVHVVANVWRDRFADFCTDDGATEALVLELDAPLGDRALTGCGQPDCFQSSEIDPYQIANAFALDNNDVAVVYRSQTVIVDGESGDLQSTTPHQLDNPILAGGIVVGGTQTGTTAVDRVTGDILWTNSSYPVVAEDDLVLACGEEEAGLIALNATTGDRLWAVANVPCGYLALLDNTIVSVGYDPKVDGGSLIGVVNRETGEIIEQRPLDDGINDQVDGFAGLTAVGGHLALVAGFQSDTVLLDATGTELGRTNERLGRPLVSLQGVAMIDTNNSLGAYDVDTEAWLWQDDSLRASSVSADETHLVAASGGEVSLLDPRTGEPLWTTSVGTASSVNTSLTDTRAIAVTELGVASLDRGTGELLWWTTIPIDPNG